MKLLSPRFKRELTYVVFLFFFSATLLELALRAFDPIGIEYFVEAGRYFRNMTPNEIYGYIHTPNYQDKLQGVKVTINSHGFRGPDCEIVKPPDRMRLMILGDSVVFGWGAPQDSIFPIQLQRLLDKDARDLEVIAAGVGSWNTRTEYEYLKSKGIQFSPDVVLLVIVENDIEPKKNSHTDVSKDFLFGDGTNALDGFLRKMWKDALSRFHSMAYIQYFRMANLAKGEYSMLTDDSPMWQDAKLALAGIKDLCLSRDITLIICLYSSGEALRKSKVLSLYKEFVDSEDIRAFTLPNPLFHNKNYRNSVVDPHPNVLGHTLIANEMSQVLRPIFQEESLK